MAQIIYSVESFQKKQTILEENLEKSRDQISKYWNLITEQPKEQTRSQFWMNQIERSLTIYDGMITGYKLFRRFRNIGNLFKQKKIKKNKK